jgi:hypothetical protein
MLPQAAFLERLRLAQECRRRCVQLSENALGSRGAVEYHVYSAENREFRNYLSEMFVFLILAYSTFFQLDSNPDCNQKSILL